jgi:hypothetical protein
MNTKHPEFTGDGYPTERTLRRIKQWDFNVYDNSEFINYLKEAVSAYGRLWEEDGLLKVATGGWSGNEDVISALKQNYMFWARFWESTHRGGLYCFRIP